MLVLIKGRVSSGQECLLCEEHVRGKAKSRRRNFGRGERENFIHLLSCFLCHPFLQNIHMKKTEFSSPRPASTT